MFSSNCCFLTCIQISQEGGKVVWYSHLLKNFPQFVVIYTVKGFGIINKAEGVFLEFSCFFYDPTDVGNLISGSSLNSSWTSGKFTVHILLKPGLKIFEDYFASMRDECKCAIVGTFFGTALPWDWNGNWPFPVLCHCWVFQICSHIEYSTLTASSFRIQNSSIGIPSPPLALFIVMLSKAHLTSYSRISGSRWGITPLWLSGLWRSRYYCTVLCILATSS